MNKIPIKWIGSSGDTKQLPDYVISALFEIAEQQGFSRYVIELDNGCNDGDGFVGNLLKAAIIEDCEVQNENIIEKATLYLVVKLPPEETIRREYAMKLFAREVLIYNEILPAFEHFQFVHGIASNEMFNLYPKCYWAYHNAGLDQSVIIMEDKRVSGYKMESKRIPINLAQTKIVMETLGQLHAISLAMKQQQPQVFEQFKKLGNVTASEHPGHKKMVKSMIINGVQRAVSTLSENEKELKNTIISVANDLANKYCIPFALAEPHCVLIHGDCWINNLMFKVRVPPI